MSLNGKMGKAHEEFLADLFGGRRTRASGAVWKDQMDGRASRFNVPFAFAWDGKSTRGKSIGVTREMWAKAVEQASGERPMLALRWYTTDRLDVGEDLVVVSAHDFAEMLQQVNTPAPVAEEEAIRVFVITKRTADESELVKIMKKLAAPKALMFWDGHRMELDEMTVRVGLRQEPAYQFVYEGHDLEIPASRRVEIYVDNLLKYTLLPGHRTMIREEIG